MIMKKFLIPAAVMSFSALIGMNVSAKAVFDTAELFAVPETVDASGENFDFEVPENIRPVIYECGEYNGKPVQVFAWYGAPVTGEPPYPAVVLVHGGGGTAFAEWVKRWNDRGFAAVAMDLQGCVPISAWEGGKVSRPHPGGVTFDNLNGLDPVEEQWPFFAVSAIVRANSLLRSFPEVNSDNIGLVGISWGGFLSCITSGVDPRFRYVIPVYGCGFLGDPDLTRTVKPFENRSAEEGKAWFGLWDPSVWLPEASMPVFMITDCDDAAYPLDRWVRSTKLPPEGPGYFVSHTFGHSHNAGDRPEAVRFANAMAGRAENIPVFESVSVENNIAEAVFRSGKAPYSAVLLYTCQEYKGERRLWETSPAVVNGNTVTAELPADCVAAFFNLTDAEGTVSIAVKE